MFSELCEKIHCEVAPLVGQYFPLIVCLEAKATQWALNL